MVPAAEGFGGSIRCATAGFGPCRREGGLDQGRGALWILRRASTLPAEDGIVRGGGVPRPPPHGCAAGRGGKGTCGGHLWVL